MNDLGPLIFAINPDAHVSIINEAVILTTKAHSGEGPKKSSTRTTPSKIGASPKISWQIGTLTVKGPKPAQIVGKGTFDADGRRIHGVLGHDVIANYLRVSG